MKNNDPCEVKKCTIYVDSSSKSSSCEQNVGSGVEKSFNAVFSLKPGVHKCKTKIVANGLLLKP